MASGATSRDEPAARRRPRPRRRPSAAALAVAVAILASACSASSSGDAGRDTGEPPVDPSAPLRVTTISGPPAYVTGGDTVLAVDSPAGGPLDGVTVTVAGRDVTREFAPDPGTNRSPEAAPRLVAHIDGLPPGESEVVASRGADRATVTVTDHDIAGPLFSGPHQEPLACTTDAAGLGPAGPDCAAPTAFSWRYVDTSGRLVELPDPTRPPQDVATTVTTTGATVPFIVRVETAVLDRSVVQTAVLDPSRAGATPPMGGDPPWDPSGWNGRLVLRFGGGCGVTWSQGDVLPTPLQVDLLGSGYAVVAGSLTSFDTACNATVSAEVALVAKEHFAETYGVPRHTIGSGGSGGAIQQLQIAQNYPGVLDAVAASALFPDAVSISGGVADCGLLERWFGRDGGPAGIIPRGQTSGAGLSAEQQMAITGFASPATCAFWTSAFLDTLDASEGCATELVGQVYDLVVRPDGIRCTFQDGNVNLLGTDPATGFAARPLDNVGVQYGLRALDDGAISVDEFLDLNEGIGGFDIDGTWQPGRERAGDEVLRRAYRAGMVTAGTATTEAGALDHDGAGGLVDVPIIVVNSYTDPLGDIHDRQRAFALRERLRRPDGSPDPNLAIWTAPAVGTVASLVRQLSGGPEDAGQPAVRVLDQWLDAADAAGTDESTSRADRLAAARPAAAADRCELPSGEILTGDDVHAEGSRCDQAYPVHADPRQAAGAPLVNDVLACHLVEVDRSSYAVELTDDQYDRLRRIFPEGVCDWTREGRGQQEPAGTWQRFGEP